MRSRMLVESLENRRLLAAAPFLFDISGEIGHYKESEFYVQTGQTIPYSQQKVTSLNVAKSTTLSGNYVHRNWLGEITGTVTSSGFSNIQAVSSIDGATASVTVSMDLRFDFSASGGFGLYIGRGVSGTLSGMTIWAYDPEIASFPVRGTFTANSASNDFVNWFGVPPRYWSSTVGYDGPSSNWAGGSTSWQTVDNGLSSLASYRSPEGYLYRRVGDLGATADSSWLFQQGQPDIHGTANATFSMSVTNGAMLKAPVADFSGPSEVVLGQPLTLTSTSYDPDDGTAANQGITSWLWSDGQAPDPDGTASSVTYNWTTPGTKNITLQVADNEGAVRSVTKTVNVVASKTFDIVVRTFIPQNYLWGPPVLVTNPVPAIVPVVFRGDGRSYDLSSGSYRTMQHVTLVSNEIADSDGVREGSVAYGTGQSESYLLSDVDLIAGQIRAGAIPYAVGHASDENMRNIQGFRVNSESVSVRMAGSAGDPIVPIPFNVVTPTIDWDFSITIDTSGQLPHYSVQGTWDGFPALEVYINGVRVLGSMITNSPVNYFALLDLYNGVGTQNLSASGYLPSGRRGKVVSNESVQPPIEAIPPIHAALQDTQSKPKSKRLVELVEI